MFIYIGKSFFLLHICICVFGFMLLVPGSFLQEIGHIAFSSVPALFWLP